MKRTLALFVLVSALTACAAKPPPLYKPMNADAQKVRDQMIGTWYGERETDAGKTQWISTRLPDGRFVVRFRYPAPSGTGHEESVEVGVWGVSGPVYFTITRGWIHEEDFSPANPFNANYYDAYEILHQDQDVFRYRSLEVGSEYEIHRVADDFEFPE